MGGFRATDPATCRAAYLQMLADGKLSKRRSEIVEYLSRQLLPQTAGEIAKQIQRNRNNVATRITELAKQRVLVEVGERECKVSGKHCKLWAMTGLQPEGPAVRKKSKAAKDREALQKSIKLLRGLRDWLPKVNQGKAATVLDRKIAEILSGGETT